MYKSDVTKTNYYPLAFYFFILFIQNGRKLLKYLDDILSDLGSNKISFLIRYPHLSG